MDGWKTKFAMWRETTPGTRFRPAGLRACRAGSSAIGSWSRKTPFERREKSAALLTAWELSLTREFAVDDTTREWLTAVCDNATTDAEVQATTAGGIGAQPAAAPITWSIETELPDGTAMRFSGLALKKWEIVMQSGRIIMEEIVLMALNAENIESVTAANMTPHMLTPANGAGHVINTALPTITSAAWPGGGSRVFSTQMIFERTLEACNFRNRGDAEKHRVGAWEITGQTICRLPSADFAAAIGDNVEAALYWQMAHPALAGCGFNVAIPIAMLRISNQEQLAGEIEHALDFHGMNESATLAFLSTKS